MAPTAPTVTPVSPRQAWFLMRLLDTGEGFSGFIPNWVEPPADCKVSPHAATLLCQAGVTAESAGKAITFLKRTKDQANTPHSKARRHNRAMDLLGFGEAMTVPVPEPPASPAAPAAAAAAAPKVTKTTETTKAPAAKGEVLQVKVSDYAALLHKLHTLEGEVAAFRAAKAKATK